MSYSYVEYKGGGEGEEGGEEGKEEEGSGFLLGWWVREVGLVSWRISEVG